MTRTKLPPLVQTNSPLPIGFSSIGVTMLILFITGSAIILCAIIVYDFLLHSAVPVYKPDYHYLCCNLTMYDGKDYWDNNNQTQIIEATKILEIYHNNKISLNVSQNAMINVKSHHIIGGGGGGIVLDE